MQDPESSRAWQLFLARQLIEPHGGYIVEEFFDAGDSRSIPWKRRPEARRLLESFRDPNRGFSAVVIGEPQRVFYDNQFSLTFPRVPRWPRPPPHRHRPQPRRHPIPNGA